MRDATATAKQQFGQTVESLFPDFGPLLCFDRTEGG